MNRQQRRAEEARKRKQKNTTLSLSDTLKLAMQLHQEGRLVEAEKLYRQILSTSSDQSDALHFLGILTHQTGRSDEALELIDKAISINPNHPDAHNNLGNVYKELGQHEEATAAYQACLSLDPYNANALSNLGTVLKEQERFEEAVASYERAIEINPQHADAYHNLGNALKKLSRIEEAFNAYRKAIALRPYDAAAYKSLGRMLYRERRNDEAVDVFEQWLELDPGNPTAQHMHAACSGKDVPGRASDAYVAEIFDTFAGSFDKVLERLEYHAPDLVLAAVAREVDQAKAELDILDAGCGTGLCGPLLRPYARQLVGVDLSQGMLDKAEGRVLYDELHVEELTQFMINRPQSYDLIISADTLCYFGTLEQVCQAAYSALRDNGRLIFTLEKVVAPKMDECFCLNPHGRYSHCQSYVQQVLQEANLNIISLTNDILRKEAGEPVEGIIVVAAKSSS